MQTLGYEHMGFFLDQIVLQPLTSRILILVGQMDLSGRGVEGRTTTNDIMDFMIRKRRRRLFDSFPFSSL